MSADISLTSLVADCARKFVLQDGKPLMGEADFLASWRQLKSLAAEAKEVAAIELVALATKFQRTAGSAAAEAIAQLFALASGLLVSSDKARALFEKQGVDLRESAEFIGTAEKMIPAGSSRISEGKNLAAFLLRTNKKAPT
jgi:hypothetical protein